MIPLSHEELWNYSFARIKYFETGACAANHRFVVAITEGKIIGMAKLFTEGMYFDSSKEIALAFLAINEQYQKRGIAKLLVAELSEVLKKEGKSLYITEYTNEGNLYLKPLLESVLTAQNIPFRVSAF